MPAASAATTAAASTTSCLRPIRARPLEARRPAFELATRTRGERVSWLPMPAMLRTICGLRRLNDSGHAGSARAGRGWLGGPSLLAERNSRVHPDRPGWTPAHGQNAIRASALTRQAGLTRGSFVRSATSTTGRTNNRRSASSGPSRAATPSRTTAATLAISVSPGSRSTLRATATTMSSLTAARVGAMPIARLKIGVSQFTPIPLASLQTSNGTAATCASGVTATASSMSARLAALCRAKAPG